MNPTPHTKNLTSPSERRTPDDAPPITRSKGRPPPVVAGTPPLSLSLSLSLSAARSLHVRLVDPRRGVGMPVHQNDPTPPAYRYTAPAEGHSTYMEDLARVFLRSLFPRPYTTPLAVLFGEVVLEDAGGGCPSERSVGSVVIVEVDEPVVGGSALGF